MKAFSITSGLLVAIGCLIFSALWFGYIGLITVRVSLAEEFPHELDFFNRAESIRRILADARIEMSPIARQGEHGSFRIFHENDRAYAEELTGSRFGVIFDGLAAKFPVQMDFDESVYLKLGDDIPRLLRSRLRRGMAYLSVDFDYASLYMLDKSKNRTRQFDVNVMYAGLTKREVLLKLIEKRDGEKFGIALSPENWSVARAISQGPPKGAEVVENSYGESYMIDKSSYVSFPVEAAYSLNDRDGQVLHVQFGSLGQRELFSFTRANIRRKAIFFVGRVPVAERTISEAVYTGAISVPIKASEVDLAQKLEFGAYPSFVQIRAF